MEPHGLLTALLCSGMVLSIGAIKFEGGDVTGLPHVPGNY